MKYVSMDIETLGLDTKHDMIEFGAVIEDTNNPLPLDQCPQLRVLFAPKGDDYVGQPYAMAMHSKMLYEIADRKLRTASSIRQALLDQVDTCLFKPEDLGLMFQQFCWSNGVADTPTAAGKNLGPFDMKWLGSLIRVRHRILDIGPLFFDPKTDKQVPDLKECIARAGLGDIEVPHTSVGDAWLVILCIRSYYAS